MDDVMFGISPRRSTHSAEPSVKVELHFSFKDLIKEWGIV